MAERIVTSNFSCSLKGVGWSSGHGDGQEWLTIINARSKYIISLF